MGLDKRVIIASIICFAVCELPLAGLSIAWGIQDPGGCDHTDPMGLNVAQYLLGSGIVSLVYVVLECITFSLLLCELGEGFVLSMQTILTVIFSLFGTAWFIVGGIILFRSNLDCIRDYHDPSDVIYALVLWCFTALAILLRICKHRSSSNN